MTQAEINHYRAAASLGLIPDEENPIFLFNMSHTDLLLGIINGEIDAVEMARMEMRARGLDEKTGRWIGWRTQENRNQRA
jgi:hypothetical protein